MNRRPESFSRTDLRYPMDAKPSPLLDSNLLDVASDVVVRFKEHDQYKGEAGA